MRKSYDRRKALLLTFLCCAVYFASYLTRTSFAAMMVEVIGAEGLKKTQVSAVTTASFAFYGAGQLLSGYLGDRFRPQRLMFFGLAVSSVCNFLLPAAAPETGERQRSGGWSNVSFQIVLRTGMELPEGGLDL